MILFNKKSRRYNFYIIAIILIAAVIVVFPVLYAINNAGSVPTTDLAEQLLQYKTDYVGDNSKVGGIISNLQFQEGTSYSFFELMTDFEPYEIIINLKADRIPKDTLKGSFDKQLEKNAAIIFSLVGNVEVVTFNLQNDISKTSVIYIREWADKLFSTNISEFLKNEEELNKLLYGQIPTVEPAKSKAEYGLSKYVKFNETYSIRTCLRESEYQLIKDIIFSSMAKSTIQEGYDTSKLDVYYNIRAAYSDGTSKDYYVFMVDGIAYLQFGKGLHCVRLDNSLYAALYELIEVNK